MKSGALIVFKPSVTADQAAKALESIAHLIELPDQELMAKYAPKRAYQTPTRQLVEEFEPEFGSPCWYIP